MRKERVPLITPRRKFDSLGISERADVPDIGSVRLRRETILHPVERWVVRVVLVTEVSKHAGDDLGDRRPRSLIERNLCGRAEDKRQAARLDEAYDVIFSLYRRLVSISLKVLR